MNQNKLRWGILGPGSIAKTFAEALELTESGGLTAVGSRSLEKSQKFCAEKPGVTALGTYEELISSDLVDAVYIATLHPFHAQWAVRALEAGKHVLCEKPLTLNAAETEAVLLAAERSGKTFAEAFMYRHYPQTAMACEWIRSGKLGEVCHIEASFCFDQGPKPEGRHQANELGGGGILDLGCYPLSMARLLAGAAEGKPFAEPLEFKALGHLDPETGTDSRAFGILRFHRDLIATISCAMRMFGDNNVRVRGSNGMMTIPSPWFGGGKLKFLDYQDWKEVEEEAPSDKHPYVYEIENFAAAVANNRREVAQMPWKDTLGNMRGLDRWREELGFLYNSEQPDAVWPTIDGRPLKSSTKAVIPRVEFPGVSAPVSRIVMGTMLIPHLPTRSLLFDEFFRLGGNAFDTAWIYGEVAEKAFGKWMRDRGIREEIFVIAKGAHTPVCTPEGISSQLEESLARLQTSRAELYLMHRDNPGVPVAEFLHALSEEISKGRIRAYGFSNWTRERVSLALEESIRMGFPPPAAISNQFSLARMVEPLWEGARSLTTGDRKWLVEKQIANFAWTSMARGFFSPAAQSFQMQDPFQQRCFGCADNEERKHRAEQLAAQRGATAADIAGAYVLSQAFPSFALVGPKNLDELHTSIGGTKITLTEAECAWLNLED